MHTPLSYRHAALLFFVSLLIRGAVLFFAIIPHGFYKQADSNDYHNCALSIAMGHGMYRADTHEPIFWRTPGYPPFLAFFYRYFGIQHYTFDTNSTAQCAALWFQIFISSFIPCILFYLALLLTQHYTIAMLTAWITALHPGLILASTYILTEGLALIFFYLFLLFLYKNCVRSSGSYYSIIASALLLSIYTWMRPMGECIGYGTTLLIFLGGIGSWSHTAKKAGLFLIIFFLTLFPWYWRNYNLTHEWFFCPTIGNYLNCFSVPKILRRTLSKPLTECHHIAQQHAGREVYKKRVALQGTGLYVSPNISKVVALPIIQQNFGYFIYDWIMEVSKTTFDFYTYHIIPMLNGSYWYDPIEEFLPDKIAACLYAYPMPWYLRLICWLEFLGALMLWIGLCAGFWKFVITALVKNSFTSMLHLWLVCLPMICIIIGMTGGFGYARLRLPAEPLLIILSLTFWCKAPMVSNRKRLISKEHV